MLPAFEPRRFASRQCSLGHHAREILHKSCLIVFMLASARGFAASADRLPVSSDSNSGPAIVVGFVGGFVHRDDRRHSEVQLAEKLCAAYGNRAHVGVFENHRLGDAHLAILKWLDADGDGNLSDSEKRDARIIIFGHSWGASAALALARQLQKDTIPVLLTIQVDSISKPGQDEHTIPANVARAVNFYQTAGPLHGETTIVAADRARTEILGDYRFRYLKPPAACSAYPWLARHFLRGHTSIECDPKVWSTVEALIGEYLFPPDTRSQLP
jgi:pimeloyl-ACP methyl ester carboxylesterase